MSAWLAHLSWSSASAIAFAFLSGFSAGAWWPRPVRHDPEYPVCSPHVSRAWLKAIREHQTPQQLESK
jgi:hypothetical protein